MRNLPKHMSGEYGPLSGPLSKKAAGTRMLTEKERKGLLRQIWLQALQLLFVGFISMQKDKKIDELERKVYEGWVRESDLEADVERLESKLRMKETELQQYKESNSLMRTQILMQKPAE